MPNRGQTTKVGRSARTKPAPPDRARAEAPGSTRERILAAAERLFAEQGYDGVSMPRIAGASGITAGAIYKHFDGKADLFFEVVRRVVQSAPTPQPDGPPDAMTLPRIVANYASPGLKRLRQLAIEIHYAAAKDANIRRLLRRSLDGNVAQIRDGVVAMRQAGAVDPAIDAQLLANAILVFIMGLAHMETIAPQLIGDAKWRAFIEERVVALIGIRNSSGPLPTSD